MCHSKTWKDGCSLAFCINFFVYCLLITNHGKPFMSVKERRNVTYNVCKVISLIFSRYFSNFYLKKKYYSSTYYHKQQGRYFLQGNSPASSAEILMPSFLAAPLPEKKKHSQHTALLVVSANS